MVGDLMKCVGSCSIALYRNRLGGPSGCLDIAVFLDHNSNKVILSMEP